MSASESEPGKDEFVERDDAETPLPFGSGGVPLYIAVLWVGFVIAYVTVMSLLALPDLRAWLKT
jgi:hypothetical protein